MIGEQGLTHLARRFFLRAIDVCAPSIRAQLPEKPAPGTGAGRSSAGNEPEFR